MLLYAGQITATESHEVEQACGAADAAARELCTYYVAGFLDGALLTDTAIVANLSRGTTSTFLDRALRTRTGREPATALADFCLPDHIGIDEAAHLVTDRLTGRDFTDHSLQNQVYEQVKALFPCNGSGA